MENAADDEISSDLLTHVARRLIELSKENAQLRGGRQAQWQGPALLGEDEEIPDG